MTAVDRRTTVRADLQRLSAEAFADEYSLAWRAR
jgi:hypothetical protein